MVPGSAPVKSTTCATDCQKARTKALESNGVPAATCVNNTIFFHGIGRFRS